MLPMNMLWLIKVPSKRNVLSDEPDSTLQGKPLNSYTKILLFFLYELACKLCMIIIYGHYNIRAINRVHLVPLYLK